jgi:hypothetical protein
MKYHTIILLTSCIILTGCVTPVNREFPAIPPSLEKSCDTLQKTPMTTKLSEVLSVITDNYSKYQECQIKVETWQQWYKQQKKIFDSVK